ncbi:hypothetical protein D1AOALGA4SA_2559 [Olavius algarvensis Delta 1 endosymbiont]|nr:hypothetical protein D1AOALGA4SA_2559 [Olavius algarvensis Delta 1 endosymbiont]
MSLQAKNAYQNFTSACQTYLACHACSIKYNGVFILEGLLGTPIKL